MAHEIALAGDVSTPELARKQFRRQLWVPQLIGTTANPTLISVAGAVAFSGHVIDGWARWTIDAQGTGFVEMLPPIPPDPNFVEGSGTGEAGTSIGWGRARATTAASSRLTRPQFLADLASVRFWQDGTNSSLNWADATFNRVWTFFSYIFDPTAVFVEFVGGATEWEGATGSPDVTGIEPEGVEQGDIFIAVVAFRAPGDTPTGPPGWTQIGTAITGNGWTANAWLIERGTVTPDLTWTGAYDFAAVNIGAWRGFGPTIIDSATGAPESGIAPSVTATASGQWLICLLADAFFNAPDIGAPVGMNERYKGIDGEVVLADQPLASSGATGTRTFDDELPIGTWSLILGS